MIVKDIVFFGISFVAFFVAFSSAITYLPNKLMYYLMYQSNLLGIFLALE